MQKGDSMEKAQRREVLTLEATRLVTLPVAKRARVEIVLHG
jgi:hypothetical protein